MKSKRKWRKKSLRSGASKRWEDLRVSYMNQDDNSSRLVTFTHVFLPKGKILPSITHKRSHEWSYVLKGSLVAILDGEEHRFKPGDYLYLPPGVWHQFRAETDVAALSVHMPPLDWKGRGSKDIVVEKGSVNGC